MEVARRAGGQAGRWEGGEREVRGLRMCGAGDGGFSLLFRRHGGPQAKVGHGTNVRRVS